MSMAGRLEFRNNIPITENSDVHLGWGDSTYRKLNNVHVGLVKCLHTKPITELTMKIG